MQAAVAVGGGNFREIVEDKLFRLPEITVRLGAKRFEDRQGFVVLAHDSPHAFQQILAEVASRGILVASAVNGLHAIEFGAVR